MTTPVKKDAPWARAFVNILDLEAQRGYDNAAVRGGLEKFIEHWREAIPATLNNLALSRELLRSGYGKLTLEQRREWVARWRNLLGGVVAAPAARPAAVAPAVKPAAPPAPVAAAPKPAVSAPPSGPKASYSSVSVDAPVGRLVGVGPKLADLLAKRNINTIRDLLRHYPHRHLDYSNIIKVAQVQPGQECAVIGQVWEARQVKLGAQGAPAVEAVVGDETGNLRAVWFNWRQVPRELQPNSRVALAGKPDSYRGQLTFESPEFEAVTERRPLIHTGRLVPVHSLTEGLTQRRMRELVWIALERWGANLEETLDESIRRRARLLPLAQAVAQAHFPDTLPLWEAARRRLAFDELLMLQLAALARRQRNSTGVTGLPIPASQSLLRKFWESLPFSLTGAQMRCIAEILGDLEQGTPPMARLLQGDVGSGKTLVALSALLATAGAGCQGAIMAPTEVLAEQHFATVCKLLGGRTEASEGDNLLLARLEGLPRPLTVGLLTGSVRVSVKRRLTRLAAEGALDLLIGTQAIIQEGVELPRLGLAVVDEQHRFGVLQRSALRERGSGNPHLLVMSATPIPRTLTLTLYGDLDISTLDEMPPGRQIIKTRLAGPESRAAAYGFVRRQVEGGRQAFIICPLVEESDAIESKAAIAEHARLSQEVYPDLRLGLLHGRMTPREKDKVMRQFRDGDLDILVSTAVVEVGIDVPNASVMLIEGAERFGLAQLHQFRGRVGRGEHQSYCILLTEAAGGATRQRLEALAQHQDGFKLAEIDLELRGPGDFFGTRQSGLPTLKMAQISDRELIELSRAEAQRLFASDPDLGAPEHAALKAEVARFLEQVNADVS